MTVKVTFTLDGTIYNTTYYDLLGKELANIGDIPLASREKLEIITVDMRDFANLIELLNNL